MGSTPARYFARTFTPTKTRPTLGKRKPPDSVHLELEPLLNKGIIPWGSREEYTFFFEEQAREIDSSDSRDKSFPLLETHHPQGWASYDRILTLLKDGIAYEGAIPVRKEFTCEGPKVSKMREKRAEAKMELLYGNYKYTCPRSQ